MHSVCKNCPRPPASSIRGISMVKLSSKLARVSRYCSGNMLERGVGECIESEKDGEKQREK